MKTIISIALIFLLAVLCAGKKKSTDYSKVLPGTVKVSESLYYDEFEISNLNWLEYMHWTKNKYGKDSPQYLSTVRDTLVWRDKLTYCEPYVDFIMLTRLIGLIR